MNASLRLAHISDPHLTSLSGISPVQLLNKRILGYLSWWWRRRSIHRREVLDLLTADLAETMPDHVVITGDLTHVGTARECREAQRWLEQLGPPERITLIPGNHDTYVRAPWQETLGCWTPYMTGDDATGAVPFPFLRQRGPVALVGLSSAVPTPPFHAGGRLGGAQLARAEELLRDAGARGLFRTVLVHHPPIAGITSPRRRLRDCAAFRSTVAAAGAEMVLHGHMHRWTRNHLETDERALAVLGVPSASSRQGDADHRAGYSLYDIAASGQGFSVTVTERQADESFTAFTVRSQRSFLVPAPVPQA